MSRLARTIWGHLPPILFPPAWSSTRDDDRDKVSAFLLQYFVNYNFKDGLYLTSSPIITANWKATSGNKWVIPFGGGTGKLFKIYKQPINFAGTSFLQCLTNHLRARLDPACSNTIPLSQMTPNKHMAKEFVICVARHTGAVLAYRLGSRGRKTAKRLWATLAARYRITQVMTDSWKVYRTIIPQAPLVQSKTETYTVESRNASLRHFLARFRRHTRCYSKSKEMVYLSLLLLFTETEALKSRLN